MKMRIFNADGSEGKTCGNGVRCSAHLAKKFFGLKRDKISVETGAGITEVKVFLTGDCTAETEADMGEVKEEPAPSALAENMAKIGYYQAKGDFLCVNVGNRHLVCFADAPLGDLHAAAEADETTRRIYNVERVTVENGKLRAEIYERGSGKTLSCGSGATAIAFAAVRLKGADESGAEVVSDGGALRVRFINGRGFLSGKTEITFTGEIDI